MLVKGAGLYLLEGAIRNPACPLHATTAGENWAVFKRFSGGGRRSWLQVESATAWRRVIQFCTVLFPEHYKIETRGWLFPRPDFRSSYIPNYTIELPAL